MGDRALQHKILAIAEEEGARQASYALKLLQCEGRVTMASTGKDPASRDAGDPRLHGGRAGDAIPHDHGHRFGRGAAEPVPGPHGQREPGADPGDPRGPAPAGDPGGAAGQDGAGTAAEAAPQRPAAAPAPGGGEPLRRPAEFPGRPDPLPPGPCEVPDPDPLHRPAAPVPARREDPRGICATSRSSPRTSNWPTSWPRRCWAAPWTSCCRRPASC